MKSPGVNKFLGQQAVRGSASDFSQFTLYPDNLENRPIVVNRDGRDRSGSVIRTNVSSVYIINLCVESPIWIPGKLGSLQMAATKGLSASAKIRGLSGQPCLVPLPSSNGCARTPLVRTDAVGWVYKRLIQPKNFVLKPKDSCQMLSLHLWRERQQGSVYYLRPTLYLLDV